MTSLRARRRQFWREIGRMSADVLFVILVGAIGILGGIYLERWRVEDVIAAIEQTHRQEFGYIEELEGELKGFLEFRDAACRDPLAQWAIVEFQQRRAREGVPIWTLCHIAPRLLRPGSEKGA